MKIKSGSGQQDVPVIFEGVKSPQQIKRDRRIQRLRELTE